MHHCLFFGTTIALATVFITIKYLNVYEPKHYNQSNSNLCFRVQHLDLSIFMLKI